MFNVLFTSIFNSSTLGESNKQQEPIQLSLDAILSGNNNNNKKREMNKKMVINRQQ
jgi:hypothetical protein